MSFYNVFFTSLPIIALGVFDQDVSAQLCLKYPFLYLEGVENILFSWSRILGWMFNGFLTSIIIFFWTTKSMIKQAFRRDGQVVDYEVLGVTMYTCRVGRKLPNGNLHQLLHLDPALLHLGQHCLLV